MATTNINIRVDELLKKDAEALFNDLGLSMSSAITMFLKSAKKRGLKLDKLQAIVDKLAAEIPLEQKHRDHTLTGNYKDFRECHIEPDWLLIYRKDTDVLELFLFRTGTHADLF